VRTPSQTKRAVAFAALLTSVAVGCAAPAGDASDRVANPVSLDGVRVSVFDGERLSRKFSAEQFLVLPRRAGPLEFAGLHELVVTRAKVELFLDESGGERGAAPDLLGVPVRPGIQLVSGSIFDLDWSASRGGEQVARIEASRAKVDFRNGDVDLRQFRLSHLPTSRVIEAPRATLRHGSEVVIEGEFVMRDRASQRTGRGLRLKVAEMLRSP
jgi:hypothetical protein